VNVPIEASIINEILTIRLTTGLDGGDTGHDDDVRVFQEGGTPSYEANIKG